MSEQRLAPPMGCLIDRKQPISFEFEGQKVSGFAGDCIASALAGEQQYLISRSFKYHRPRGLLSMAGHDSNTLVQLPDEPNVLADRHPISEGLQVSAQHYSGSLKRDYDAMQGWFSRFMPVGFYYRAFYKPLGIWDKWEKVIRAKAGLGKANLDHKPGEYDKAYLFHDVVVVGAGPAGLSAALTAAKAGADVLLVDEGECLGGAFNYHRFGLEAETARQQQQSLVDAVQSSEKITVLLGATCNGWFTDNFLPVIQGQRMYKVRAKECVMAVGCIEQLAVFHNNDLPGVMMSSAAMRLMGLYGVKPGNQAVVLAGNDDAYLCALTLHEQGVAVKAVVDMRRECEDPALAEKLAKLGIQQLTNSTVYEAISGKRHIRAVSVRSLDDTGQAVGSSYEITCDLLCMAVGYMPTYQLLCQAGAKLSYNDDSARFAIEQLPEHLYLAGSANGVHALDAVVADGEYAAMQALVSLGYPVSPGAAPSCQRQVNHPWPIVEHPKGKNFIDFDEDLQVKDIVHATELGFRDIQLVKRFSTVGMGPSQGRHSALPTARLVAKATGRSVEQTGVTTARPPYGPELLSHVAGRSFHPYQLTPMHAQHQALGAQFMPAGSWQRPAYYGVKENKASLVAEEVANVRNNVGLIDVSTLGGIELRGPDAAEFLERLYTFRFKKQPIGRTRYALHTNEQGVVRDDGVACRIAEQHFYVTATTGGVVRVFRDMLKWNAQWRLDVDIANVSAAYAAVNLAGPNSRKVLESLCDIDISTEAFPYLGYREGKVAGIPARLLRVGFVGELGFEIHVPARFGSALWSALMQAGEAFAIRPFGVEAQRLLRLEKGHIIVGQDTDGMTHPGEVALNWAIDQKKPFFVGGRSVQIAKAQQQKRALVGFTLAAEKAKPEEGHLVLDGDIITGNVTSCELSPTLGCYIGMAYASEAQAKGESPLPIRVDGGELVHAQVSPLPFFDPDNQRQEL